MSLRIVKKTAYSPAIHNFTNNAVGICIWVNPSLLVESCKGSNKIGNLDVLKKRCGKYLCKYKERHNARGAGTFSPTTRYL